MTAAREGRVVQRLADDRDIGVCGALSKPSGINDCPSGNERR